MADRNDPIEVTPVKRRKLDTGEHHKVYNSQDDSGDELTMEDYESVATVPLAAQKKLLHYGPQQLHSDLSAPQSSPFYTAHNGTQPTQTMKTYTTQPTQPLPPKSTPPPSSQVQVACSSPTMADESSPAPNAPKAVRPTPQPMRRAPFARPTMNRMAPPGTTLRLPPNIHRQNPEVINLDDDEDPPIILSDDETQTQARRSNIRPTQFSKGGRGLDSSPNVNRVQESPQAPAPGSFAALTASFLYAKSASDSASAYGNVSRPPKPQTQPARALPVQSPAVIYETLEDIDNWGLRKNVQNIQAVLPRHSVQRCMEALLLKRNHVPDAMSWLEDMEDAKDEKSKDDLHFSPIPKGVAKSVLSQSSSQQPRRPAAKQQVNAPAQTIAQRYAAQRGESTRIHQPEPDEEELEQAKPKPTRRRLQQGRRPRSSSPASSPLVPRKKAPVITIVDDSESEAEVPAARSPEELRDERVLKFLNEHSVLDTVELCARPEEEVKYVLDQKPFTTLDKVRSISMPTTTKTGRKGKPRDVGEMLVTECSEVLNSYSAVDVLVNECERIAGPVKRALREWGVGDDDGELHVTKLDSPHDSGVATPSSSCPADDIVATGRTKKERSQKFIGQPENMNAELPLKDYQLVGINWLNLLFEKRLSCILADDMGLGKTCQVIGFLSHLKLQKVEGVHMVVVPPSTLENWLREFEKFSPSLNVRPYYGAQGERFNMQHELRDEKRRGTVDVIITTYQMVVSKEDNKFFRALGPFGVCVYDEAHELRNPETNKYGQLVRISANAEFKVFLTGTPMQNNLQELVAILAFLMPDLFDSKKEDLKYIFRHKATTNGPSLALLSAERLARAKTLLTPFILRRKKEQVLDLPQKINRLETCEMAPAQAKFYATVQQETRTLLTDKANGVKGKTTSNVLMALRKAAIHPLLARRIYDDKTIERMVAALVKADALGADADHIRAYLLGEHPQAKGSGDFWLHKRCTEYPCLQNYMLKNDEWLDSAKVQKMVELVKKHIANGDRTLIFSQFTMAMDVLEAVFETLGIKFYRLDGSTRVDTRQDMIDRFYEDTSIPVFMLSTKAGGAGINLACANKVIIFDSGFNPQDDIQAENRAHRVGQTKEVEVVRLITKGTVEEKIHALGESKLAMGEGVAGDGSAVEKSGEEMIARMLMDETKPEQIDAKPEENARKPEGKAAKPAEGAMDLKAAFKLGMESEGVEIASKQAQF